MSIKILCIKLIFIILPIYPTGGELFIKIDDFTHWRLEINKISGEFYYDQNFQIVNFPNLEFTGSSTKIIKADAIHDYQGNGSLDDDGNEFVLYYGRTNIVIKDLNNPNNISSFVINIKDCDYGSTNQTYFNVDMYFKIIKSGNAIVINRTNSGYNDDYEPYYDGGEFFAWEYFTYEPDLHPKTHCFKIWIKPRNLVNQSDYGNLIVNGKTIQSGQLTYEFPGFTYPFTTYSELVLNNKFFRNWDLNNSYRSTDNFYIDNDKTVSAYFHDVFPLTVTNNLEGYSLSNNYKIKWNTYGDEQIINSNDPIKYVFEFKSPTFDRYKLTAINSFNALNTVWYFQNWGDGSTALAKENQEITQSNNTYSIHYKGSQRSDNVNAFENSSSKNIVKTDNGYLHCIYESMGKIFYEYSSDNGVTWDFTDFYNPIIGTKPSIEYIRDFVFVSFITPTNNIQVNLYWKESNEKPKFEYSILVYESNPTVDINSTPVLAIHENEVFTIVWKELNSNDNKLYCRQGYIGYGWNGTLLLWKSPSITKTAIEASTSNSVNPAISALKTNDDRYPSRFDLVWQGNNGANSAIKYCEIIADEPITFSACTTLSALSGHPKNYKPSIITITNFDTQNPIVSARVCWIGEREIFEEERFEKTGSLNKIQSQPTEKRVIFTATDYLNHYWNLSGAVTSVQINKFNSDYSTLNSYTIGWGRGNVLPFQFTDNRTLSNLVELNIGGEDVQVVNGVAPDVTTMNAFAFNNQNFPYYMRTQQIYNSTNKENLLAISSGREGVVQKDSAQFYFTIGDLNLNSEKIDFIEIPQTVEIDSLSKLNYYLVSEPFTVSDNSTLSYSVLYGLVDSASASNVLGGNGYVNFKVELLDALTNQVIGLYDEISYNATNLFQYNNMSYQVNMNGIGNREVMLRLVVDSNIEPNYSVSEKYSSDEILPKRRFVEIQYKGKLGVTEYALEQNYPNPFNPVTTIRYQIPKAGRVTLKVYDILGKEITTLVNEEKETGRYTVNFDASALSSGVYLYEIVVKDYRAVKKLMAIK